MRELRCLDLDGALAAHQAQGFRLDTIIPADDPAELLLSRGDELVRLVRDAPARARDDGWHRGRAGMDYRDLVPDRRGGALTAGDCIVQPPGIRHRVLECAAGLEVIEVASPAVHATHIDHVLALPTPRRDRTYGGQRFAWCRRGELAGVAVATAGLAEVRLADALEIRVETHELRIPVTGGMQ